MKKKSLMFLITVTLVIAAFALAGPASAGQHHQGRAVFEADIVPVDVQPLPPLNWGRVEIRNNGEFKVKIKGAEPITNYEVLLVYDDPTDPEPWTSLGTLSTNKKGNGKLFGEVCVGQEFVRMPWIEIYLTDGLSTPGGGVILDNLDLRYVSGFAPVQCDGLDEGVLPTEGVLPGGSVLP
jgi:hypothetical protein